MTMHLCPDCGEVHENDTRHFVRLLSSVCAECGGSGFAQTEALPNAPRPACRHLEPLRDAIARARAAEEGK